MKILKQFIASCGGNANLRRIQRIKELVIAELIDPNLYDAANMPLTFNSKLQQISWLPETPLSSDEWQLLESIIDSNLRSKVAALVAPKTSSHKPTWHIHGALGFLGDPNGFVFFQGAYHLFYVVSLDCEDKLCCWAHVSSTDLVHWTEHPIALMPSSWFDSHGVYSGHIVVKDERLMVFYTGNVRIGEQRKRMTYQCLATSDDGINFTKHGPVVDKLPPNVTPHCRDPKVVRNGDHWLMLLGAQLKSELGRIAGYRSDDLINWQFSKISGDQLGDFGYMWECPDLLEVDGQLITIICPQGIPSHSAYQKVPHLNGYFKTILDEQDELHFSDFARLDYGFDFYAMQTGTTPDNRQLLVAWMGMPEEDQHPSREEGWLHQLTCVRELSFENNWLYQRPARELQALRSEQQLFEVGRTAQWQLMLSKGRSFELQMSLSWQAGETRSLHFMSNDKSYCSLSLDSVGQRIVLDRTAALATDGEKIRELKMANQQDVKLQILVDQSSIEVFINDGEFVMTAVVFSEPGETSLKLVSEQATDWQPISYWKLAK